MDKKIQSGIYCVELKDKNMTWRKIFNLLSEKYNLGIRTIARIKEGNHTYSKKLNGGYNDWSDI